MPRVRTPHWPYRIGDVMHPFAGYTGEQGAAYIRAWDAAKQRTLTLSIAERVLSAERASRIVGIRFEPRPALSDVIQAYEREHPRARVDRDAVEQELNERGTFAAALAHAPKAARMQYFAWYGGGDVLIVDECANELGRLRDLLPRLDANVPTVEALIADLVAREAAL